jgi:hypothetical protein
VSDTPNLRLPRRATAPPETDTEITGRLDGMAEQLAAMAARADEVTAAMSKPNARTPAGEKTRAVGFRSAATVAVVAIVAAAGLVALFLWLRFGMPLPGGR